MALMQRIQTVFTGLAGSPYFNTLYFDEEGGSPNDRVMAVDAFWTDLASVIVDNLSWTVLGDVAFVEDTTGEIQSVDSVTEQTGVGLLTADPMPPATQGLLRLRTGAFVGGRQIQGKVFVPGIGEDQSTTGSPAATCLGFMQDAGDGLLAEEPSWRVYSPTRHTSVAITAVSPWTKFAVLRSRRD